MPPEKNGSKKSETLEVRMSFETKEALRKKASADGRSISRVIRSLIHDYLSEPESSMQDFNLKERVFMLKRKLFTKPKSALAGTLAVAAAAVMIGPIASADEINLSFKGEFVKSLEDGGNRTKRIEYSIIADSGEEFTIEFELADQKFSILMTVTETKIKDGLDGVMLSYQLRENRSDTNIVIANPVLMSAYGEDATVQIDKGEGISYSWTVRPEL